jgi:hypothetical protein
MCCQLIAMRNFVLWHFVLFTTCIPMLTNVDARSGTTVVDIGPSADWVKVNVQKIVSS